MYLQEWSRRNEMEAEEVDYSISNLYGNCKNEVEARKQVNQTEKKTQITKTPLHAQRNSI